MNTQLSDHIKIAPGFWEGLRQVGIDPFDVARTAGMPGTIINEPEVSPARYFSIWAAFSDLMGDTAEGIVKLATAFQTSQYPPTVLATYHASDYRAALKRMVRYKRLCPPEIMRIREQGEECSVELEWLQPAQPGPPMLVGITLAFLLELGRRGTGQPLKARRVEFAQPMGNTEMLESYFGCRIRSGTGVNKLTLHRRDLDRPFISYNEELLQILTPALDHSLDEQQHSRSVTETVIRIIKRSLTRNPDIQVIAKELGMSDRTLQRRLSGEDTSFQRLLTQAKHEQAKLYLADPLLDIKEVAFLLGYEDPNSFYRAFRLWEGETPANWRLEHPTHM